MERNTLQHGIQKIEDELHQMTGVVPDGIVDLDEYLAADLKIMWILKEANSPARPSL